MALLSDVLGGQGTEAGIEEGKGLHLVMELQSLCTCSRGAEGLRLGEGQVLWCLENSCSPLSLCISFILP